MIQPPANPDEPRAPNGLRVLVVDDELTFRDGVCEILLASGYLATSAASVPEALRMLAGQPPDILISDIMMPGIDGLQFIRELRRDPRFANLPVLVVSAKASSGDEHAALAAGTSAFLAKPFSARDMEIGITEILPDGGAPAS